jgi:hypothetical protein
MSRSRCYYCFAAIARRQSKKSILTIPSLTQALYTEQQASFNELTELLSEKLKQAIEEACPIELTDSDLEDAEEIDVITFVVNENPPVSLFFTSSPATVPALSQEQINAVLAESRKSSAAPAA